MSKKITAQFHSVDAAEIAARFVRSHIDGIEDIAVISRKRVTDEGHGFYDGHGYLNQMNGFAYGATSNNRSQPNNMLKEDEVIEPALKREAYLSVTVEDDLSPRAERLMRSLGGLQINVR